MGVSHLFALPARLAREIARLSFATGSLGMDIRLLDGVTVIARVIAGSPAAKAGLRPGFIIATVDGKTSDEYAAAALHAFRRLDGAPISSRTPKTRGFRPLCTGA